MTAGLAISQTTRCTTSAVPVLYKLSLFEYQNSNLQSSIGPLAYYRVVQLSCGAKSQAITARFDSSSASLLGLGSILW